MTELAPDMKLRISLELRRKIEEAAKQNGRTMNGEINRRLEASFTEQQGTVLQRLDALEAAMRRLDLTFGADADEQATKSDLREHAERMRVKVGKQ